MKTKLVLLLGLLYSLTSLAQTDGWYLYTKASEITKIVPDEVNLDELHLATDIGYIKYNTSSNSVTDFSNLTSQNPAIGKVKDVAQDPTSNNLAFALVDGIAIYDGSNITIYNYDNSDLSIGESTSQFLSLQLEYAKDGSLYIFKEDVLGYQKFNNGTFESEQVTSFRPKDIVENSAGTKVFFAGDVNGLWELDKATDTWTNYTSSNSDLISNFVLSLFVDSNDLIYIGGFQGINTLTNTGVWNTYQELDPLNAFPYQAHSISVNESTGLLVVSTSAPSTYYFGLSIVDLSTNTWTNYREDDANCLNENVYTATAFGGNGKVYAAPTIFSSIPDIGKLVEFTPSTENCLDVNINYLNAPVAINTNVVTDISTRTKASGNINIGFTRTFDLHQTEIDPNDFNGVFSNVTTLTPSPGNSVYSVIDDNDDFIVETNTGWVFIDDNNNMATFDHNLPSYLAFVTKKAANHNSDNGIINLIHKGFDEFFNYRIYKTQCNTATATCSTPEEIFTGARDISQNILFGAYEDSETDQVDVVALKTDDDTTRMSQNGLRRDGSIKRSKISFDGSTNSTVSIIWDENHPYLSLIDPIILSVIIQGVAISITILQATFGSSLDLRTEHPTTNAPVITSVPLSDNPLDMAIASDTWFGAYSGALNLAYLLMNVGIDGTTIFSKTLQITAVDDEGNPTYEFVEIPGTTLNTLPKDIIVKKVEFTEYSPTEALIFIFTNYGLLVKTAIDISNLTLSTNEISSSDSEALIFPNPTKDLVNIGNDSINKVLVFDANGRLVFETNKTSFSMKHLEGGVYFVKAESADGQIINGKVIKR